MKLDLETVLAREAQVDLRSRMLATRFWWFQRELRVPVVAGAFLLVVALIGAWATVRASEARKHEPFAGAGGADPASASDVSPGREA